MSWTIGVLKNTIIVPKKCAKELVSIEEEFDIQNGESPVDRNRLCFGDDEHADWLENDSAIQILEKHQVKGEVLFGSVEGDNAGSFWGYRFIPGQKTVRLRGKIRWTAADNP